MSSESNEISDPSEPSGSAYGALRFLWASMTPRRRTHFYVATFVTLLGTLAELMTIGAVIPLLAVVSSPEAAADIPGVRQFLQTVGGDNLVLTAALVLILAAVTAALIRLLLTWVTLSFVLIFTHELGNNIFGRMLRQPYAYYISRNTSELIAGVEKIQSVGWGVLMPGMQAATAAFMSLAIIILLFVIDPFTAMLSAAVLASSYILMSLAVRGRLRRNSEEIARAAGQRIQTIQEGLGGIRDIILEQSQSVFEQKFRRLDYAYRTAQKWNNFITLAPRFVVEGTGIALIAILALYFNGYPGGVIAAIPTLGALAIGAQRLLPLLQQAYSGWSLLAGHRQSLLDVVDLMRTPVITTISRSRQRPITRLEGDIVLQDVGFQYNAASYALTEINLNIRKGARVGLVGETGSGKSTLLDVIMGLLEPTSGSILIDGQRLDDESRANWQAKIAHVPQYIYLTDSSIAENIAFGELDAELDMGRVHEAAHRAHIDEFIACLPEGYSTKVGERGVRLSGGQRQRIGIARALYKRASVLVFDEATSALDSGVEAVIMQRIFELEREITLIMIAHRTTTLSGCDQIVRLASGKIVETGSYDELLGSKRRSPGPRG